eukprot:3499503-Rhodomonas_salina.4
MLLPGRQPRGAHFRRGGIYLPTTMLRGVRYSHGVWYSIGACYAMSGTGIAMSGTGIACGHEEEYDGDGNRPGQNAAG